MKVLILTITTGQGHNQVAGNLSRCLFDCGLDTYTMDVFEYINPVLKGIVSKGYLMSTKSLPKVYGKAYRKAEKRETDTKESRVIKITSGIMAKKLEKFIENYRPNAIICTHVFAAMLVSAVKNKIDQNTKTVGIVTDFTIHPYWEETSLDYYITATDLLINQAVKKGISESSVIDTGIPIDPKFSKRVSKEDARKALGIEHLRTVLVMSGSMGYGKIAGMIKKLDEVQADFQIISVCGHNERLKNQIDKLKLSHKIYNFGYSDKVDVFMDAADCIITKPGGLTTSEALAKGLPIIMANPIPGHEDRNVEFLLNNGAAIKISNSYPVDEAVYQLFANEKRLDELRKMVEKLGKPDSSKDFTEFILKIIREEVASDET